VRSRAAGFLRGIVGRVLAVIDTRAAFTRATTEHGGAFTYRGAQLVPLGTGESEPHSLNMKMAFIMFKQGPTSNLIMVLFVLP
jgi:hypothetical protein